MSNAAESVLSVARSQIGATSGKKYWDYVKSTGEIKGMGSYGNGNTTPWCACFVSWCFHEAGARCVGLPATSCTYHIYAKAKAAGKVVSTSQAKAGDVILFNFDSVKTDSEHVGIIESVEEKTFITIEGNTDARGSSTGGKVARKTRPKSSTFAIVRPDYGGKAEWVKSKDGRWWYRHSDGSYTKSGWEKIDGKWYYFDKDGWMLSDQWVKWKGKWCWLKSSGACATSECLKIKGAWYAFGGDGYMKEGMLWIDDSGALKL